MPVLRRLLAYVRPHLGFLALALVSLVVFAVFSSLMLYLVKPLFTHLFEGAASSSEAVAATTPGFLARWRGQLDLWINGLIQAPSTMGTLERIAVLLVIVMVVKTLFYYVQGWAIAQMEQRIVRQMRDELYVKLHSMSLSFFHRNRTGHLVSRVTNDVAVVQETLQTTLTQMVREPLLITFYAAMLLSISWPLTFLAALVVPAAVYVVARIGFRLRRYSTRTQESMAHMNDLLEETIAGIRVVKAFAMGPFEIRKFKAATTAYFRAMMRMVSVRLLATPAGEVLGAVMVALVIWLGGRQVYVHHTLTSAEFITFLVLMFAVGGPVKSLANVHIKLQQGLAAAERVFDVLDSRPQVEDRAGARVLKLHERDIVLDHVTFRYDTGPEVLRDICLKADRGEVLALVGPSGAGKSTLLDLIPRFYDPVAGSIRIDGQDIRDVTIDSLRARMGIVTQDVILFNDTVLRNIAYGVEDADPGRIRLAAEMANAADFIAELPEGFETIVGQRGVRLSGGQRQRIAIARALMKDPDILIFDEATSALDSEAEHLVQGAIDRLMRNRTVFVVAHRLSTIQHADRIAVIDGGVLVEEGTHLTLYDRGGLYRYLYDLQFANARAARVETEAG